LNSSQNIPEVTIKQAKPSGLVESVLSYFKSETKALDKSSPVLDDTFDIDKQMTGRSANAPTPLFPAAENKLDET
jgi:hypothetical protein